MKAVPIVIATLALAFILRRLRGRAPRHGFSLPAPSSGIGLVADREIRQRLRGRTFRVTTLITLLAVGAAIVIPTIGHGGADKSKVAITGTLTAQEQSVIRTAGRQVGATVEILDEPSSEAAIADVRHGKVDLAVLAGEQVIVDHALTASDDSTEAQAARTIALLLARDNAVTTAGLTPQQIATIGHIQPLPIRGLTSPKGGSSSDQGTATIGLILLFFMLSQYGTWTLIGVMEEKASRVVEVLLAAVRPTQLLGGKVLGIGTLVFGQATILVGFALGLGAAVGSNVLTGTSPSVLVAILGWLVLGYGFYSWVFAAAGSMVERQDQVQALIFPITIPLLVGYVASVTAVGTEHASAFVTALAYLPPTAPFAMPALVAVHAVTWWQLTLSALLSVASTVAMARLAAKIYQRAVLRTGGRVPLRDVIAITVPTIRGRTRSR
ncbi:MAG TPA: ABC transporter permease [Mycobacteriales bacterium]|nr:ABC transporter permease [Mycobacteriales bacterium]